MSRLEVGPELRRSVQSLREEPSGLGRYATLAAHQFVDALHRDAQMRSQRHLRHAERLQKLLTRDRARGVGIRFSGIMTASPSFVIVSQSVTAGSTAHLLAQLSRTGESGEPEAGANIRVNIVPTPRVLSTCTEPPMAVVRFLTIASPNPVPTARSRP